MASPNLATMPSGHNGNGRPNFASQPFFDKKGMASLRTSTPESEVVNSSDDERDQQASMSMSFHSTKSASNSNPAPQRRPSWLSEVQQSSAQAKPRKFSIGGASHASSGSQPTTPMNENGPWETGSNTGRPGTGGSGHMWSSQIWSKDRPSRLVEVMPSPTGSANDELRSPSSLAPGGLPFDIPLEPNRKTIRSQSYSAGQLEKIPGMEHLQQQPGYSRMRSVAHRPSRPSMLGEGSRDVLGSLREDEDDNDDLSGSDGGYPLHTTTSLQNPPRGTGFNAYAKAPSPLPNGGYRMQSRSGTFPLSPGSDYAVADEHEEANDNFGDLGRAMARNVIGSSNASAATNLTAVAPTAPRSKWQSQLGFGVPDDGSQSRRHSFAAEHLPSRTRNNLMANPSELGQHVQYGAYNSLNSPFAHMDQSQQLAQVMAHEDRKYKHFNYVNYVKSIQDQALFSELARIEQEKARRNQQKKVFDSRYAASYFVGAENMRRNMRDPAESYNPFALPNVFSRPQRILYLVVFKCSRADIYYIPENTGLQAKTGDTVIVEGDRGQDLGTVEAINISMEAAKKLKEEYLRKQYKCLMMFSRMYPHIAAIANDDDQFEQAIIASKNMQQNSIHGAPQPETEPRPKMIKRVARPDEVHLLREKEGNEAKAKRVCQTKVNDHGLRMEILDAEFQHDYRKLTFFYYAEEYINFNDLVTDLFKVYKTRIWMSAINPASFTGAGNPHTGQRAQQWPRQGSHANYVRTQEHQYSGDAARTQSPIDYDSPAARGNREFERLYGNAAYPTGMTVPTGMDRMAPMLHPDYPPTMPSAYGPPGAAAPFSPNANQFTPFANQFGNMPAAWPQVPPGMGQPFQYPDATANYAVAPPNTVANLPLNQQAFTPRVAMGQAQGSRQNHALAQTQPHTNGHPANGEQDMNTLEDQLRRFNMNQRPPQ